MTYTDRNWNSKNLGGLRRSAKWANLSVSLTPGASVPGHRRLPPGAKGWQPDGDDDNILMRQIVVFAVVWKLETVSRLPTTVVTDDQSLESTRSPVEGGSARGLAASEELRKISAWQC